jgi:hypothetical protein
VPSLIYAILWMGVIAFARGISMLVTWVAVAIDVSLLLVCFLGLEIGGLILVPSVVAFLSLIAGLPAAGARYAD